MVQIVHNHCPWTTVTCLALFDLDIALTTLLFKNLDFKKLFLVK